MTRRRKVVLAVVPTVLVVAIALPSLLRDKPEADYVRVTRGPVRELVSAVSQGTVKADKHLSLPIYVTSAVRELPTAEGSAVKKGDVLAVFDDRDSKLLAQAERARRDAALAQAKLARTQLDNARRELGRSEALAKQGAVSGAQLDRTRDALAAAQDQAALAEANQRGADASLQQAELQLERHVITSPLDGILVRLALTVGELPNQNTGLVNPLTNTRTPTLATDAIQVLDPQDLYVEAQVDERDLGRVKIGQSVELTFDALAGRRVSGSVSYVRPLVEVMADKSRQVTVRVTPDPSTLRELRLGMGADTEIVTAERSNVLCLPPQLVLQAQGKHQVLAYDGAKVSLRDVVTGLSSWHATEIVSGLNEGDTVLWPPEDAELKEGERLRLGRDRTPSPSDANAPTATQARP